MERQNAGAGQGPVLLDIGDGTGALVVYAPATMAGVEIEISPEGQDARRSHVAVLARPGSPGQPVPDAPDPALPHAAVYPALAAGRWNLWHPGGPMALSVEIEDGAVRQVWWPASPGERPAPPGPPA